MAVEIVERNLLSFFLNLRHWDKAELHLTPSLWWSKTPVNHPVFNAVHNCRLSPYELQPAVETIKALGIPVIWRVWPGQEETATQLEKGGFIYHGAAAGMVADLSKEQVSQTLPTGLVIKQAKNSSSWFVPFVVGFSMPDFVAAAYQDYYSQLPAETQLYHYTGWLDSQPVASASLWLDGQTAGLYNVATVPKMRGRGIGAAMSRWAMQQAKERGYQFITLQASPDAVGMYRRLGFEDTCQIGHYIYGGS